MPSIGPVELIIVLVIALIILGPSRLPDVGSALGKSIREFRRAATDVQDATSLDTTPKPVANSRAVESMARISPDGRWITFVTDESGTFRIDSVPPGKYRLLVWHERGESQIERDVEVSAAGTSRVDVKLKLK